MKNKFFTLVFAGQMDKRACPLDPWRQIMVLWDSAV